MKSGEMYRVWIDLPRVEERLRDRLRTPSPGLNAESWLRSIGLVKSFEGTDWLASAEALAKLEPEEVIYRQVVRGGLDDAGKEQPADGVGAAAPCDVLVVEDDAGVRYAIEKALAAKGLRSVSVSGFQQARALLSLNPRWIVLDLRLPDGDGEEILHYVNRRGMASRVIVTTAFPERVQGLKSMKTHAVFVKPFDPGRLVSEVMGG